VRGGERHWEHYVAPVVLVVLRETRPSHKERQKPAGKHIRHDDTLRIDFARRRFGPVFIRSCRKRSSNVTCECRRHCAGTFFATRCRNLSVCLRTSDLLLVFRFRNPRTVTGCRVGIIFYPSPKGPRSGSAWEERGFADRNRCVFDEDLTSPRIGKSSFACPRGMDVTPVRLPE